MAGETELRVLLKRMEPVLAPEAYGYAVVEKEPPGLAVFARVAEAEGLTLVAEQAHLRAAGITAEGSWARISLSIHSDLEAVGLTAAIATALAQSGISANVIAGYHHDHFFVQWTRRDEAMAVLKRLSRG